MTYHVRRRETFIMNKFLLTVAFLPVIAGNSYAKLQQNQDAPEAHAKVDGAQAVVDIKNVLEKLHIFGEATVAADFSKTDGKYFSKPETKNEKDSDEPRFSADGKLAFAAEEKMECGTSFGLNVGIKAARKKVDADKMFVSLKDDRFGTVNFGTLKGPDEEILSDGQGLLGGVGGIDGNVEDNIDLATGTISPIGIVGNSGKATKLAYYTPEFAGFQLSFAFTPDTKLEGTASKSSKTGSSGNGNDEGLFVAKDGADKPSAKNNMVFGLSKNFAFNEDWQMKLAGAFLMEDTKDLTTKVGDKDVLLQLKDARSFRLSGSLSYKQVSLAAGYLNNGKSRLPKSSEYTKYGLENFEGFLVNKDGDAGQAWNVGMKYSLGKSDIAVVYHNLTRDVTKNEKTKGDVVSLTVDYALHPGFIIFGEFNYISMTSSDFACKAFNKVGEDAAVKSQDASVFVVGAKVNF